MAQRLGLMGCGLVAIYGHLPALAQTEGVELTAVYDPSGAQLAALRKLWPEVQVFDDMDAFLASGIDAVTITSPAPCHLENIRAAARAGKHILCEKPLGMTDAEIEEMMAVTQDAGVMLFTAFDYRFSPVAQKIRQLVAEKAIGEVRSLRLIYIWNLHGKYLTDADGNPVLNARREGRMLEGGPMVDCGVHQIDLARYWLQQEVVSWTGRGAWVEQHTAPDHMYLHMDHQGGAHTMVEISFTYCQTAAEPISLFSYDLIGTDGIIRFDRWSERFEMRTAAGTQQFPFAAEKNFVGMYQAFVEALATGHSDTLPTAYDGLMATRIARTATEQAIAAHTEK